MGSGKGKSKRTSARSTRRTKGATLHLEKWAEFVNGSGLEKVLFSQYYCGQNIIRLPTDGHEEIIKELFKDAVAVGAIVLPERFTSEDFKFEPLRPGPDGPAALGVALESAPDYAEEFCNYAWERNPPLSSSLITSLVRCLAEGINNLIIS